MTCPDIGKLVERLSFLISVTEECGPFFHNNGVIPYLIEALDTIIRLKGERDEAFESWNLSRTKWATLVQQHDTARKAAEVDAARLRLSLQRIRGVLVEHGDGTCGRNCTAEFSGVLFSEEIARIDADLIPKERGDEQ